MLEGIACNAAEYYFQPRLPENENRDEDSEREQNKKHHRHIVSVVVGYREKVRKDERKRDADGDAYICEFT